MTLKPSGVAAATSADLADLVILKEHTDLIFYLGFMKMRSQRDQRDQCDQHNRCGRTVTKQLLGDLAPVGRIDVKSQNKYRIP